jgi:Cu/Zn superoxide dismutase
VAALPAAAAAHKGKPQGVAKAKHGHPGSGALDRTTVRLAPATGQKAKGVATLKQRSGALSVELVVSKLTPNAFYAAHVHAGTCAAPGATQLTLPDVYADEHGVARLVTTVPTAAGANFLAGGYSVDVHAGPTGGNAAVLACGDIAAKVAKSAAKASVKGANGEHGQAALTQKGTDVAAWVSLKGLTPGAHGLQLIAGSCAAPGAVAVSLGDVTAGPNGFAFAKVNATSTIPVVGKGYAVVVTAGPSSAPGAAVACGDLWPARWHGFGK